MHRQHFHILHRVNLRDDVAFLSVLGPQQLLSEIKKSKLIICFPPSTREILLIEKSFKNPFNFYTLTGRGFVATSVSADDILASNWRQADKSIPLQ
jgi:hypothetical protein